VNAKKKSDPNQKARASGENKAVEGAAPSTDSKATKRPARRAPSRETAPAEEKNMGAIVMVAVIALLLLTLVGGAVWMVMKG
jgi:hypothetical protein